ncbi:non-homologous end-joining DNA ligase [Streptomyces sp. NPDC019443]|uniref:non-homologous end-joining DNA ligase n=1 Tax=Streptomyces sp. NPDC019443 TaxID=3365061 RepID=UPI0037BCBCEA
MNGPLDRLPAEQRELLRPAAQAPGAPMLATLTDRRDFDDDWIFERKLDGIRVLATRNREEARLLSRGGTSLNDTYPEVVDALTAEQRADFTVDGEMVALHRGRTDFARLQQRSGLTDPAAARRSGVKVTLYLFDLLRLDGHDTTRLPLRTRKILLRDALDFHRPLSYTPHRNSNGHKLLNQACARGWEGLIAKRADTSYVHRRSTDWLKLKCAGGQEFVVGGFTEPAGSRVGFGALLLGYYEDGRLRYAGKVGTGWDAAALRTLRARLNHLEQPRSPFHGEVRERRAHWVRPELVAQIGFTEWTRDGMLRHPRYLGLRDDKPAREVVREQPTGRTG